MAVNARFVANRTGAATLTLPTQTVTMSIATVFNSLA